MSVDFAIKKLVTYGLRTGLIEPEDGVFVVNALLEALKLDSYTDCGEEPSGIDLPAVLNELMDDAHARGVLPEDSIVYRDLFEQADPAPERGYPPVPSAVRGESAGRDRLVL